MKLYGCDVTEAENYSANSLTRLNWQKFKQFDKNLNGATLPTQMFLVKLARNNAWSIICAAFDDKLNACYQILVNANMTADRQISYKQICESCKWKKFKLSENGQNVIFTPNH